MSRLGMSRAGMSRAGMSRVGAVLLLLCSLPLLASAATRDRQEAAAHAADGAQIALLERRLLAEMGAAPEQLTPEDYGAAADAFGKLVARARELGLGEQYFASLATSGERLRLACRAKVRDLERATGEDETALEALYRSELWYEINRALSAFGYWRSWALLGVAQAQGPQQRLQALHRAEAGFKAASVRILYPGLVQGAWLGLGYVALARDDPTTARQRFERLVQALAERPDNAVRKVAESELTLLALRRGEVAAPTTIPKEPLSPTLAAVVAEEAFALLERRRRENIGAMPAGERLRKLIADGYLSDALLARILAYRDEIVGEDLGVISRLIDAEFAYAYEQYKTTVIKYRQFREQGGERLPIDTGPFHYHFVIALLRTELPREARLELERLRKLPQPNPAVIAALPKLEWLIAEAVYDQHPTEANRAYFERAAGTFVAAAPKDGDVAAAHLGLARTSRDAKAVNRHLRIAGAAPALRDGVALTALHRGISDFNRAVARGDVAQQIVIARDLLAALNALPRKLRREPWQRALTPSLGNSYAYMLFAIRNAEAFATGKLADFAQVGVEVLDARTLRVTLDHPTPYFLQLLDHFSMFPVHRATLEQYGDPFQRGSTWTRAGHFVGNGPFVLDQWALNKVVVAKKSPTYWDAAQVKLNAIHYYPVENVSTEERMFRAGQLHLTASIPPDKIEVYRREAPELLRVEPYLGNYFYRLNTQVPQLADPRVRRALAMSIDREQIVEHVTKGGQQPAHAFTPPDTLGYTAPPGFAYDPEAARQLLAEAGYPDGKGFPPTELLYNTSEGHRKLAVAIQQMWKRELNLEIALNNQDWKVYLDSVNNGHYQIARAGWIGDYVDPNSFLDMWVTNGGNNQTHWGDAHYDDLVLNCAPKALDRTLRHQCFREAEALLMAAMPVIPIFYSTRNYLAQPSVRGLPANLLGYPLFKQVYLAADGTPAGD